MDSVKVSIKVNDIIRNAILNEDQSKTDDIVLLGGLGYNHAVEKATNEIVDLFEKEQEENNSSKTVLPNMENAVLG